MKLKTATALVVTLAMAVGRIKRNRKDKMRSLAQAAWLWASAAMNLEGREGEVCPHTGKSLKGTSKTGN